MWNGTAETLKPKPTSSIPVPSTTSGPLAGVAATALVMRGSEVEPDTP